MQTAANDIAERAKSSSSDTDDAIMAVDGMISRVENLKRKVWIPKSRHCTLELIKSARFPS